jgi:acyl carrier protein
VSSKDLSASVRETLRRVVPTAPAELEPEVPFRDQFEMDSLDYLNFVLALEKEHGVRIPEVRYPKCASLTGAAAVLQEALVATTP